MPEPYRRHFGAVNVCSDLTFVTRNSDWPEPDRELHRYSHADDSNNNKTLLRTQEKVHSTLKYTENIDRSI